MSEKAPEMIGTTKIQRKPLPSTSTLAEVLDYDPETGFLHWKIRPARLCPSEQHAGKRAFINPDPQGYLRGESRQAVIYLKWTCKKCGHKNRWRWKPWDHPVGNTRWICDKCEQESRFEMHEKRPGEWRKVKRRDPQS